MVKTLRKFETATWSYPWDEWTDGRPRRAKQGEDFRCSLTGFRSVLYSHAYRNDLIVRVSIKGKFVDFQFIRDEPPKRKRRVANG